MKKGTPLRHQGSGHGAGLGTGPARIDAPLPPPGPVRSVYVHAPFCARRCLYCDFAVTVSRTGDGSGWLDALSRELRGVEDEGVLAPAELLETLYVGGGTPSVLGAGAMEGLVEVLGPSRFGHPGLEWTAEANPESFSREVAEGWHRVGVNRLSLGAQSFQEAPLRWMGRLHGPEGPLRAVERAREAGIENVSLDLIFGLPAAVPRDWEKDLESALRLEVPHLSLYGLTVEKGTPLARAVAEGSVQPVPEDAYREEFLLASRLLREAGYRQYEVSNFALPGFESAHNLTYWEMRPYLGLGSSAHSFQPPLRRWNLRAWDAYQKALLAGRSPVEEEERLTPADVRLERVWLALRTRRGVSTEGIPEPARLLLERWVEEGLARARSSGVSLTPEGWLLLDHLAVELDAACDPDHREKVAPPRPG